jgi:putative ABC transport system permease protein
VKGLALLVATFAGVALTISGLIAGNLFLSGIGIALPFLTMALFYPLLRRLALRNAVRRPRETVLILLGSLLGTAIITSSGVVGDTFAASDRATISQQLGPVDEFVSLPAAQRNLVSNYLAKNPSLDIDGVLDIVQLRAAAGVSGDSPRAVRHARIIDMSFEKAASFGGDPKATGISGPSPAPGSVVITTDVARDLDVEPGGTVEIYALGQKVPMKVDRVLDVEALAGLNLEYSSGDSHNLFVAPGTLEGLARDANDLDYVTLVSNTGDTFSGSERSGAVSDLIKTSIINQLPKQKDDFANLDFTRLNEVVSVKADRIKESDQIGTIFRRLFIGIGSFTIAAGILLLINIFTMLAQERQSELGMLRAIGLRRRALIVAFSLEGFLYALGSAFFGTLVGVAIGRIVALVAKGIFSSREVGLDLHFDVTFASMERGFVGGLGISMLTVVLASLFIARMNVIRAIRELPDASLQRKRLVGSLIGGIGILWGAGFVALGLSNKNEFLALSGPAILGFGVIMLLRRWVPTKPLVTITSALVLLWSVFGFVLAKKAFANPNAGVYVLQGIQLTAFAVVFVSANQEHIGSAIRLLFRGPFSMALRLGLAYPLARRGRTGLLLAMYSLVIFVLTFIMTIANALTTSVEKQVEAQSGGSDIQLRQLRSVSPGDTERRETERRDVDSVIAELSKRPDLAAIAPRYAIYAEVEPEGKSSTFARIVSFDQSFVGNGSPRLKERSSAYSSDEEALRAVATDPAQVVISNEFATESPNNAMKVGDKITITKTNTGELARDARGRPVVQPPKQVTLTVAAISFTGSEVSLGKPAFDTLAVATDTDVEFDEAFIKVKDGADSKQIAAQISGLYITQNIEADSIMAEVEEGFGVAKQFLMLIQGYMAIGLLVGIAGLGVVMVRAVRERRRQIGMLRAMGFPSHQVRRSFLAESAFIASEGILIGATLALVVLNRTFSALPKDVGINLDVPWLQLAFLIAVTFGASMLATLAPAQAASRISPAVALRTTD